MGLHLEAMGAHRQSNCRFCCCSCVTVDRLIRICYIRIFIVNFIMNFIVNFFMNFIMNFIMNSVQFFSLMTFFTSGISLMGATMFLQNYLSLPAKVRQSKFNGWWFNADSISSPKSSVPFSRSLCSNDTIFSVLGLTPKRNSNDIVLSDKAVHVGLLVSMCSVNITLIRFRACFSIFFVLI